MSRRSSTDPAVRRLLVALSCAVLALGCAAKRSFDGLASEEVAFESVASGAFREVEAGPPAQSAPPEGGQLSATTTEARKLIRNASVTLEVSSTDEATAQIRALVEAAGGYVGSESRSEDAYGVKSASLTCRVPADALDELLEQAQEQGEVEALQITAQDITEQYFDLEIRLATQTKLESRLLVLLDRSSNELKDLLEIERELARVRGQIDQMEGRRRFWDHQVTMATLQLELHEPRPAIAGSKGGMFRTLSNAFREAGDNFVGALAFLISSTGALVPVVSAFAALIWLLLRLRRRSQQAKHAASEEVKRA